MKIFALIILVACVLGGLIGGELTDTDFTILGATVGGVGTFVILMFIAAYFNKQEKNKKDDAGIPPEILEIIGRRVQKKAEEFDRQEQSKNTSTAYIADVARNLVEQDLENIKRGEIPERRLIPHHAIKRDIILKAYLKDFSNLSEKMQKLNIQDYQKKVSIIMRLGPQDLDNVLKTMKLERRDCKDLEIMVRNEKKHYSIVEPIFI